MSKSGFFLNDKKSKFSLVVEQRFTNTSVKPILCFQICNLIFNHVNRTQNRVCVSFSVLIDGAGDLTSWTQTHSPTSSTTTTSQRTLKFSSRSSPATAGPQICTTLSTMTAPSAWRSLHHCSPRSEKMQRAVDKLITLPTKACCQVSRCLSVMWERRDLLMGLVR